MDTTENTQQTKPSILELIKKAPKDTGPKEARFQYQGDLYFHLRFIPKARMQALSQKHSRQVMNPKTRQNEQQLDMDSFRRALYEECLFGWEGMTAITLAKLLPSFSLDAIAKERQEEQIPFDFDLGLQIAIESYDFETWVQDIVTRVESFFPTKEAEVKN